MVHFTITLAGISAEIHALYSATKIFCQDYLSNDVPLFSVTIAQQDIDYERDKSEKESRLTGNPVHHYKDSYLETLAVYRKLTEKLLHYDIILFHGAVLTMEENAYLFTAPSGTGKTTHIHLWKQVFGDSVSILNGDKPLLKITQDGIFACGTPWQGKENEGENRIVPLKAICILERSETNHIESLTFSQALPVLLQQTYRPTETEALIKTMELIKELHQVDLYRLGCNMNPEAAEVAYVGMQ